MLARAVLAVCVLLALVQLTAAATAKFSLCYKFLSYPYTAAAGEFLDEQYSVAVEINGTYTTTVNIETNANKTNGFANGSYVNLATITGGRRYQMTRNAAPFKLYSVGVPKVLDPVGQDFADNRLYLNGAQFIDGNGITYNYTNTIFFAGKVSSNQVNLYRSGVTGPVYEDKSSNINGSTFSIAVDNIPGWTGATYTAGSCAAAPVSTITQLTLTNGTYYTLTPISYFLTNSKNFNISFTGTFYGQALQRGTGFIDPFGDQFITLGNVNGHLGVSGTRRYCTFGTLGNNCTTSTVTGSAPIGAYGFVDNRVYTYYPFLDYNGPGYLISPSVPKPGYNWSQAEANPTSDFISSTNGVNIYYSKGGYFLEGFGVGGTGTNGKFNTSASVTSYPAF